MTTIAAVSGDDVLLEFAVTDQDGAVVDITGMDVRFEVAKYNGDAVASTEASPQSATYEVTDAPNGLVEVAISNAITEPLRGTYSYELKIEDTQQLIYTVIAGFITFKQNLIEA